MDTLLERITNFYLNSRDFNGIPLRDLDEVGHTPLRCSLKHLILSNKIELVFGDVHPNPHIRSLKNHNSPQKQVEMLGGPLAETACAYPHANHLRNVVDVAKHSNRPYTLALMLGEPQLMWRSFDLVVLEAYRSDPRYHYRCSDISGTISVGDKYFESENIKTSDQVHLQSFGFSYDNDLNKYVAAFLRYLSRLSPEHQRLWQIREVSHETFLHPDYFRSLILGDFPNGVSIYVAFIEELKVINRIAKAMKRPPLFQSINEDYARPQHFSSLLRPTAHQYADFVLLLDKLISDNINVAFFQKEVPHEEEIERNFGKIELRRLGSITIMNNWLSSHFGDSNVPGNIVKTFKEIRKLRQKPAHAIEENAFDQKFVRDQRELMERAYAAARSLRLILTSDPSATTVEIPRWLNEAEIWAM